MTGSGRSAAVAILLAVVVGIGAGGTVFAFHSRQFVRQAAPTLESTPGLDASQASAQATPAIDAPLEAPPTSTPTVGGMPSEAQPAEALVTPTLQPAPTDLPAVLINPPDRAEQSSPSPSLPPIAAQAPTPAAPTLALVQRIESAMAEVVPKGSATYIGPGGQLVARYQAGTPRVAASTIKLPLVLEALRQEAAGTLDLSTPYTVRPEDVVGGTGILQQQVGRTLSLRELIHLVILYSDNVATNVLLDRVGMDQVNANTRALGFAGTHFERKMLDTVAEQRGKENWTTADDLATMLRALSDGSLLSPTISGQVLSMLAERGSRDLDWIGNGLPKGTPFSHINGTLDRVRNDAGIVGLPTGQDYVLVVCQDQLADPTAGEHAIAELSRRVNGLVSP